MTKILVIEDETILREEVVAWLTLEGYTVLSAEDGVAGVAAALHHQPDLIVCDILMPRLDGYGVLIEVRSDQEIADTPFIFVTARAAYEDMRKGMDLGADDYLTKPFTRLDLLQAIQTRLAKKALQEQAQQRAIAELQQALARTNENQLLNAKLISMFSHDFANSLTSILLANSLLRDYADRMDEKRRLTHLNRIGASARLLLQMLDDLVVVARMETGSLEVELVALNITEFFERIVQDFQSIYGERHPLILESQFTTTTKLDTRLLRQIATNLISNAIAHSPPESAIHIRLAPQAEACVITVHDQGIDTLHVEKLHLFAAFQHNSPEDAANTGLGLAIIQQAVDLHGGLIEIENHADSGTTVTVTLPIQPRILAVADGKHMRGQVIGGSILDHD